MLPQVGWQSHCKYAAPSADRLLTGRRGLSCQQARSHRGAVIRHAAQAQAEQPAEKGTLYDDPVLYEVAFGLRSFKEEVSFLTDCFQTHSSRTPTSFLELWYAFQGLQKRPIVTKLQTVTQSGVKKQQAYAVDSNPGMIAHARSKVQDTQKNNFIVSDACNFALPDSATVDLAALLLGSLSDLETHEDVINCFKAVHAVLNPDGLFVLEQAHPGDIFDGTFLMGEAWDAPQQNGPRLLVEFGSENDAFDPGSQVVSRQISISEHLPKGYRLLHKYVQRQRIYTMQEVVLMAKLAGLKLAATYGDMSGLHIGLKHEVAYRAVMCFQKVRADSDHLTES